MMYKKIFSVMVAMSVVMTSIPNAEAAFGRSSSSSSSRSSTFSSSRSSSSSYSAPSRSSSSNSAFSSSQTQRSDTSSSRFGGGMSLGKSRPDAVNSVRDGSYKDRQSTGSYAGGNNSNTYTPQYNSGSRYSNNSGYSNNYGGYNPGMGATTSSPSRFGVGSLAAAAVAGGLVGYLLHTDNKGNTYYTNPNNPGVAYAENGQVLGSVPQGDYNTVGRVGNDGVIQGYNAPVAQQSHKSGFPWGWIFFFLIVGGVLYLLFGRKKPTSFGSGMMGSSAPAPMAGTTHSANPEDTLSRQMDDFFVNFQNNNRPSQLEWIRSNTTPLMFNAVRDMVEGSDDNRKVIVRSMSSEMVDVTATNGTYEGSVRYRATIEDDGETQQVDEVWNFLYDNGRWKLNGIDQV